MVGWFCVVWMVDTGTDREMQSFVDVMCCVGEDERVGVGVVG